MPPSSSTSSSRRARRGAWVCALFAAAFAAALAASAWRLTVHGLSRDRTDRVVHEVTRMRGVNAETLVLSDSVTAPVTFLSRPAPGVVPAATNGYMRLAGQYLLFRRFLEHNTAKRMFFFGHPTQFVFDLSDDEGGGLPRYTYFDSVFTRADEQRIVAEAGAVPRRRIDPRFENLLKSWYPNPWPHPLTQALYPVIETEEPIRPEGIARPPPPMTPQVRYFLRAFEALCRERKVACTLVQVPTRPDERRFDMRAVGAEFPGLRFVDMHDFGTFPADRFPDGMHLDSASVMRYARQIQAHVARLFDARLDPWDGGKVEFTHPAVFARFASETLHWPESWGTWGTAPALRMRFEAGRELRDGELRVAVVAPPQPPGTAHVPVSLWLDGVKLLEKELPSDGRSHELRTATGPMALAPGRAHVLEVRVPRATTPAALGLGADSRELGAGIAYVAYCEPGRCGP